MKTHQKDSSKGQDEWLTPPEIVQALGRFDLDPCAPAVQPWPTADQRYALPFDDGLSLSPGRAEYGLIHRLGGCSERVG